MLQTRVRSPYRVTGPFVCPDCADAFAAITMRRGSSRRVRRCPADAAGRDRQQTRRRRATHVPHPTNRDGRTAPLSCRTSFGSGARAAARARIWSNDAAATSSAQPAPSVGQAKQGRKAPHLQVQVGQEVLVAKQDHIGLQRAATMRRQRATSLLVASRELSRGSVSSWTHSSSHGMQIRPGRSRVRCEAAGRSAQRLGPVEVGALVVQRDRHVQRLSGHHEIHRPSVDRQPVERSVRLDDPAPGLGIEAAC